MTARYGLSLYPGLDNSEEENKALLQEAHTLGYGRIFTSLQIPEADRDVLRSQAVTLFKLARDLGFEIMADVSPATVSLFQWPDLTPDRIADLGITTVRFDYGIEPAAMAAFSRVCRIQCNASTVREEDLHALEAAGCDLSRVEGLHNFYPHPYTGLSLDYVRQQNSLLHRHGAKAGMFLAGRHGRRSPLKEGLPTVEAWRDREPADVAEAAWNAGCDFLLLSESRPSTEEMEQLAAKQPVLAPKEAVRETDTVTPVSGPLVFHVKPWLHPVPSAAEALSERLLSRLFDRPLSNRPDPAESCIRVSEGRSLFQGIAIPPQDAAAGQPGSLPVGTVLVDNSLYGRYAGETQILLQPRPSEPRSVPVGRVAAADLGKLAAVGPGTSFRLVRE